jgi:hypothetical protein
MPHSIDVLTAPRLPELWRRVCSYAGLPTRSTDHPDASFVVRCGENPPELVVHLLEEAVEPDGLEITTCVAGEPDYPSLPRGQVVVRPGFEMPCPLEVQRAMTDAAALGDVLLFAVERRGRTGKLNELTWVAMPDELPVPEVQLSAAVAREAPGGLGEWGA